MFVILLSDAFLMVFAEYGKAVKHIDCFNQGIRELPCFD